MENGVLKGSIITPPAMAPAVAVWVVAPLCSIGGPFLGCPPVSRELISLISVDGDTHALFMAPAPSTWRNIKYTSWDAAINITRVEHDGEGYGSF